ncbi:signal peptide peptidase SppA [Chimaeribacter arupi]|uniref:Signal peptide peptidase SppA n=1 Tax=Nissabacter archeti TaxID=1917880 RepID=A0ABS5JM04_9GAMM|nr:MULTISPECIES: signal peptide peptidase SppA [Yersiniaceae]MBS0970891.1 signal peptide peptidase SppA [Nissabacter archeti]PLR36632.1 signal peptide peptidase SppA [Chimaeribacter arupi]WKZ94156.1 signal peptide peptidase SppA [Chimaeribacter arupi]
MRTLWRIIAGLFRWTWRLLNFIRECILNLFLILLIVVAVGIYFQLQPKPAETAAKGALLVDLSGTVVDKPSVNNKLRQWGRELLGSNSSRLQENSLFDLVETLRRAKSDPNITGIVLSLNDFTGTDQTSLNYIGKALQEFRDAGKPIYAVGDSYNQIQYYLASYATKIFLSPQGTVDLHGFATNTLYYKTLLEKLKVSTHIFRVGTYKSAVEPMIRDDMSPAAREADSRWVGGLWQNYLSTVAANRRLTPEQLFPGAPGVLQGLQAVNGDTAEYALKNKLVDALASRPQVEAELSKAFGWNKQDNDFNSVSIYDYEPAAKPTNQNPQIAVIFANGAIIDGPEEPGSVGGDTTAAQIRQARLDPKIKAVVLRVNSPGGSVSASEVIREELAAVRAAGKPVVVSMGGMAASGGYWISTPANYIVASPSTLTGSIGIFGVVNTYENSLDSIGVHTDGVATSPLADLAVTKALPPEFAQMMQLNIENGYRTFLGLVAQSRHKTPEQIDQIAQGHVWLGLDAKNNGLVDELGDFDDAVKKAAELAKLPAWQLNWFVEDPSVSDLLFSQMSASVQAALPQALQAWVPAPLTRLAESMKDQPGLFGTLNDPQNRYALCLTCGEVK